MFKKTLLFMLLMTLLAPWAAAQSQVLSEDFDAMTTISTSYSATDWYAYNAGSGNNWSLNTSSSYAHSGSNSAQYNYNSSNDANCYLVSAPFDVNAKMDELGVSVYEAVRSSSYSETFEVFFVKASDITDAASVATATQYSVIASASYNNATFAEVTGSNSNSALAGQSVRIVVHCTSVADRWTLYIDDITVTETLVESCPKPKNLEATNITDESATLTWTSSVTPSNGFNVRYRTAEVSNASFFDDFESGLSQWTTLANDYDGSGTNWRQFNVDGFNSPSLTNHSGSYVAMSRSYDGDDHSVDNWLITPQVALKGTLKFWAINNDGAGYAEYYSIYVSTTGNDVADFTEVYVPADCTAWTEYSVDLSSYAGASGYIAIRHIDDAKDFLFIDDFGIYDDPIPAGAWVNTTSNTNSKDITGLKENTLYDFEIQSNCGGETSDWVASTFTTLPSCMPVANLAVSDATTTTISLTWTDQNSGTASYIVTDGDDNPVTVTNLTITGCTVTGLTANTAYTFKVTADCGSTAEIINTRTDCNALATFPYEEGFEASSTNIYCWELDGFGRLNNSTYAHTGSVSLYAYSNLSYAILPATATNISELMLNFWYYNFYDGYDFGSLEVGYLTDEADYSTFVTVGTIDMSNSSDTYTQTIDYVFTGAPAGARIALKANPGTDGLQLMIDDVTVDVAPNCMKPTDLDATPYATSAQLSWTANSGETSWNIFYKKTSETDYTELKKVTDNPYPLTGLNAATDYEYYVVANCSSTETSDPSAVYYFSTTCGAFTITASEHYKQNFETPVVTSVYNSTTGLEVPICWENPYTTSSSAAGNPHLVQAGASYNYSADQVLLFYGSGYNYVTLPEFTNALNELQITFKWATESSSSGTLTLGYITDGDVNYNTFTEIAGASYPASSSSYHTMLQADPVYLNTLPATAKRLVFRWYYGYQYSCNVDDVEVSLMPSCYPIGTLTYDNLASQTVDLHWTLVDATQDAWQVCLNNDETNLIDITATDVTISGNAVTYSLSGLTAETAYTVKVRANCGSADGVSEWSNTVSFTTLAACATPTGLTASMLTQNGADLAWTGSSDVAAYTVQYRTAEGLQTHYFEGFESGIGDWTMVSCASSTGISTGSSYAHTGNAAFKFSYNTNPPQYLVSPAISGITSGMKLEFWYKNGSTSWPETFQVGFSSTDNDVASFAFEDEITASDAQWHSYSVAVPASTKYLCFKLNSNDKLNLYIDDITIGAVVAAGSWQTADNNVTTWNYTLTGLTKETTYDARVYANCETNPDANNAMTTFTTMTDGNLVFTNASGDGLWSTAGNWVPSSLPTINDNVILHANATITGDAAAKKITFEGSPTPTLTINDGGTLQTDNTVTATVKKNITGYDAANANTSLGYYLISNPLTSSIYAHTSTSTPNISSTGLLTGTYDLYSWDYTNSNEWTNYEAGSGFSLSSGLYSYLYANESNVELTFTGTIRSNASSVSRYLNYTSLTTYDFPNMYLLGNPFMCNAYLVNASTGGTALPYYKMENDDFVAVSNGAAIAPMQGIFFEATASGYVYMSRKAPAVTSTGNSNLNITVAQVVTSRDMRPARDNAIISFSSPYTMTKFSFRDNSTKVYIPQNGRDYAVVYAEAQGEMPICFKAEMNGAYTLSFTAENVEFSYLHLIDNKTGNDVDLLANPSYTFDAQTTDYASRFKVVFAKGNNGNENNFGFISDGQLILTGLTGNETLQVIDALGRVIVSTNAMNRISTENMAAGVYVLRLINGENVQTQKIVVK